MKETHYFVTLRITKNEGQEDLTEAQVKRWIQTQLSKWVFGFLTIGDVVKIEKERK